MLAEVYPKQNLIQPWYAKAVRQNSSHNFVWLRGPSKELVNRFCPSRNVAWYLFFIKSWKGITRIFHSSFAILLLPESHCSYLNRRWACFHQILSSTKDRLLLKFIFLQKTSSVKSCLPTKVISPSPPSNVVFHRRTSSIGGTLRLKVVFLQRLSALKCHLPSTLSFHQWSSSMKDCLPSKVVFHQRLSLIKDGLPSNVSSIKAHGGCVNLY